MSLYSPDLMTAEAEYLVAASRREPKRRPRHTERGLRHSVRQLQPVGDPEGRRCAQA